MATSDDWSGEELELEEEEDPLSQGYESEEYCPECDIETYHRVALEVRESGDRKNAEFSREPYRVAECWECGYEESQDMSNI